MTIETPQPSLSPELLRRRLQTNLDRLSRPPQPGRNGPQAPRVRRASRVDRLKGQLIERILPRVNLTSYNNLRRARIRAEDAGKVLYETQLLLGQVAADRDRLAPKAIAGMRLLELSRHLIDPATVRGARELLVQHWGAEDDPNLDDLLKSFERSLQSRIPYWDVRVSVRAAAVAMRPASYLEIGVRRGWSLGQVFDVCPGVHAFACDVWVPDYAGAQGDPDYVLGKVGGITAGGQTQQVTFLNGNSHELLPDFFAGRLQAQMPAAGFDLVTVDGDHTLLGAWWDLLDVFPNVSVGGAVIFDDLDNAGDPARADMTSAHDRPDLPPCESLLDVWLALQGRYPNFVFLSPSHSPFATGIAFRVE